MDMLSPHRQAARLTAHRDIRHRCHRDSRSHPDRRRDRARARGPEQRQGASGREPTERAPRSRQPPASTTDTGGSCQLDHPQVHTSAVPPGHHMSPAIIAPTTSTTGSPHSTHPTRDEHTGDTACRDESAPHPAAPSSSPPAPAAAPPTHATTSAHEAHPPHAATTPHTRESAAAPPPSSPMPTPPAAPSSAHAADSPSHPRTHGTSTTPTTAATTSDQHTPAATVEQAAFDHICPDILMSLQMT